MLRWRRGKGGEEKKDREKEREGGGRRKCDQVLIPEGNTPKSSETLIEATNKDVKKKNEKNDETQSKRERERDRSIRTTQRRE